MSNLGESRNFSGMRHAEFDDSDIVFGFELEQLQGQSEMVVEIAQGFKNPKTRGEQMRDDIFCRGLPG